MNRAIRACVSLAIAVAMTGVLSGCWDIKSIQDVDYFIGIGIDYTDGQYIVYIQQLDFSSVAKSEGGKNDKPAQAWVGHARGVSLSAAVMELFKSSQQLVFWGHLKTVILSENLLRSGMLSDMLDTMIRSPEIRLTPWIYATKEPMQEIFSTKAFFDLSPLNTILYAPESSYKQKSTVVPMRLYRFVRELRDPGCTVLLPILSITSDTWVNDRKPDPKLELTGVYALHRGKFMNRYSYEQLSGLKWMSKHTRTSRIVLERGGKSLATIRISNPQSKITIKPGQSDDRLTVTFKVHMSAEVTERGQQAGEEEIRKAAIDKVRGDIEASMQDSIQKRSDLFNIEHELFRKHNRLWRRLTLNGSKPFLYDKVPEIQVDMEITDSAMRKLNGKLPTN